MDAEKRYRRLSRVVRVLSRVPLCITYVVADLLYLILYYVVRYRVKVTRSNLQMAFPEQTERWRRGIERKYYRHLCDTIVECVRTQGMSDEEIDRRIKVYGLDVVARHASRNRSIMLFLGHYGNWEWVPAITRHFDKPECTGEIYRPIHDQAFDRVMLDIRSRFRSVCVPQAKAVRTLLGWQREHGSFMVGFIADQRPNSANLNHWTTFLGLDTSFPAGAEQIGSHVDAAYVYLDVERVGRGYQNLTFREIEPLDDGQPFPYTRAYYRMMEQTIRRAPQYWLWSHRRWLFDRKGNVIRQ